MERRKETENKLDTALVLDYNASGIKRQAEILPSYGLLLPPPTLYLGMPDWKSHS
jgi:hypothetical protein